MIGETPEKGPFLTLLIAFWGLIEKVYVLKGLPDPNSCYGSSRLISPIMVMKVLGCRA